MLEGERAVRGVVAERVWLRSGTSRPHLPRHEPGGVLPRDLSESIGSRAWDPTTDSKSWANAVFARGSDQPASAFAQTEEGKTETKVSGKATSSVPARSFGRVFCELVDRRLPVEYDRLHLDTRDSHCGFHRPPLSQTGYNMRALPRPLESRRRVEPRR